MSSFEKPYAPLPWERDWLRRHSRWLSLLGVGLGLVLGRLVWPIVLLNRADVPGLSMQWFTAKGVGLGFALGLLPWIWRGGIRMERERGWSLRRWPIAPLLAVLGVLAIELALRSFTGQSLFWQAVRARSGNQHQAREVSLFREEAAACRRANGPAPGIVLLGSSQLVYGVDTSEVARQTGQPVYRRAVAGLFIAELVASQEFSNFHPDNHLALMLSAFDFGARDGLFVDAIRPQATLTGIQHLWAAADWPFRLRYWRTFMDLHLAARCDLWRSRDYARFLLEHPFSPAHIPATPVQSETLTEQKRAYGHLGSNPAMVHLCYRAFARFLADMASKCRQITVLEGRVNPTYPSPEFAPLALDVRQFLAQQQQLGHIRFIPIEEQHIDLPVSVWRDMTHVNAIGRTRLTRLFAQCLATASNPPPRPITPP